MTDNVTIPATGATIGTKDVGGVQIQRVALTVGGSGVATDAVGGAGAATSGTVRTVSASDDPAVVAIAALATSAQVGEVQASPTANTVLARLKELLTGIVLAAGANVIGRVGIDQTNDGTSNLVAAKQSGSWNVANVSGTVSLPTGAATSAKQDTLSGLVGEIQASPTANTVLDRLKAILTGTVLATGSNVIGKVGIDQTTDGTTNLVAAKQSGTWTTIAPVGVTITSHSGTVTSGGTAQQLMAANASRHGWFIQNNSDAELWVNVFGGTAVTSQPSLKIAAGDYYESSQGGATGAAISIIGATTGKTFTAGEY
jgi:hypothetical protein